MPFIADQPRCRCPGRLFIACAFTALSFASFTATELGAQSFAARSIAAATRDSLPRIPLFTRDDAYLGAFFLLGTAALAPFDKRIANELQQPSRQTN